MQKENRNNKVPQDFVRCLRIVNGVVASGFAVAAFVLALRANVRYREVQKGLAIVVKQQEVLENATSENYNNLREHIEQNKIEHVYGLNLKNEIDNLKSDVDNIQEYIIFQGTTRKK